MLRELRAGGIESARATELRGELEGAGVDWRSFLTPIRGSTSDAPLLGEAPKNHTLRQIAQKLNLVRGLRQILAIPDGAEDLAADGSVLDSAFFTNRDVSRVSPDDLRRALAEQAPQGAIALVEPKTSGTSEGFIGKDESGDLFIFVLDPPDFPEMSTAAEVIGSTIVRLAGYNVPYPTIVRLDSLTVAPEGVEEGLGPGDAERFEGRRAVATRMIAEGFRGEWTYWVFRERRELRALHVFGAWLNNTDQVDHNTLVEVFDEEAGLVRYWVIDFSGALGASSARVKDPWDGWINNQFDLHWGLTWPLRLLATPFGFRVPWDPAQPVVSPAVGRFDAKLDPRAWKPFYPNLAYEDMEEADAEWAARIVGEFSDELIDAIVELARYSRPEDAGYVADTLKRRRDVVVEAYLGGNRDGVPRGGALDSPRRRSGP
ncbi:MAG: hypothetical protein ABR599_09420 [Gemmatimonadota bacterium]